MRKAMSVIWTLKTVIGYVWMPIALFLVALILALLTGCEPHQCDTPPEICRNIAFAVEAQCDIPGWSYLDMVGRKDGTCNSASAYDEAAYDECVDMLVTVENDACTTEMLNACAVVVTEWKGEP